MFPPFHFCHTGVTGVVCIDPHLRLYLSYQIWKEKKNTKTGNLLRNSRKHGSAGWILKWKHILVACGLRDTKEGFCSQR